MVWAGGTKELRRVRFKWLTVLLASRGFGAVDAGHSKLTGNTTGIPPRTPLEPSSLVFSLNQSFSSPFASFQLSTVAPKSSTSTLSPVGNVAVTRELPSEMVTWACGGSAGVVAKADGLLGLSTIVPGG